MLNKITNAAVALSISWVIGALVFTVLDVTVQPLEQVVSNDK